MAIRFLAAMGAALPRSLDLDLIASSAGEEKGVLASVIGGAAAYTFQIAEEGAVAAIFRRAMAGSLKSAQKHTAHDTTGLLHLASPLADIAVWPIDCRVRSTEQKNGRHLYHLMNSRETDGCVPAIRVGPFVCVKTVSAYFGSSFTEGLYPAAFAGDDSYMIPAETDGCVPAIRVGPFGCMKTANAYFASSFTEGLHPAAFAGDDSYMIPAQLYMPPYKALSPPALGTGFHMFSSKALLRPPKGFRLPRSSRSAGSGAGGGGAAAAGGAGAAAAATAAAGGGGLTVWECLDRFLTDMGYTIRGPLSRIFFSFAAFTITSQGIRELSLRTEEVSTFLMESTEEPPPEEVQNFMDKALSHVFDELNF